MKPNEKDQFLKLLFWNNHKFPYENLFFSRGSWFFLSHNVHNLGIVHTKFGCAWTIQWPNPKNCIFTTFVCIQHSPVSLASNNFFWKIANIIWKLITAKFRKIWLVVGHLFAPRYRKKDSNINFFDIFTTFVSFTFSIFTCIQLIFFEEK